MVAMTTDVNKSFIEVLKIFEFLNRSLINYYIVMYFDLISPTLVEIKKKSKIVSIDWISSKEDISIQFTDLKSFGRIDLSSGECNKSSYPSNLKRKLITVKFTHLDKVGEVTLGFLTTCEVLIYSKKENWTKLLKGPCHLKEEIPKNLAQKSLRPIEHIQNFLRVHFTNDNENVELDGTKSGDEVAKNKFSKPHIFSSHDLSKIVIVHDFRKVYVWCGLVDSLDHKTSMQDQNWGIYEPPDEVLLPVPGRNKGVTVDAVFTQNQSTGTACYISFCFLLESSLIISTLTLEWNYSYTRTCCPSADWQMKRFNLSHLAECDVISNKRSVLLCKFAYREEILCVVINSFSSQFHLMFYNLECESVCVVHVDYPKGIVGRLNRSQWVSCIEWNRRNNLIIGCLKSGHIFFTTPFGRLISFSYSKGLDNVLSGKFVQIFPYVDFKQRSSNDASKCESLSSNSSSVRSKKPLYSVLTHSTKNVCVISSGYELFSFSLPQEIMSEEGMLSFLLKGFHRSVHNQESMMSDHEYDFIHCSNWRLASRSRLDIPHEKERTTQYKHISLWFPGTTKAGRSHLLGPPQTETEIQKRDAVECLQAVWNFMALKRLSRDSRLLIHKVVKETKQFFNSILKTLPGNDDEEHQGRLILCLRIFHNLVEGIFSVSLYALHMFRPLLKLSYYLIQILMKSVDETSIGRKLICISVLSQTLLVLKSSLTEYLFKASNSRSVLFTNTNETLNIGVVIDLKMKRHWAYLYSNLLRMWREPSIKSMAKLNRIFIVVANVIQENVLKSFSYYPKIRVNNSRKLFYCGQLFAAINESKSLLERTTENFTTKRQIKKEFFFIFHSLVLENEWKELLNFICWSFNKAWEKKSSGKAKVQNVLKIVFMDMVGSLGVFMAKQILNFPLYIKHNLEYYNYSNLDDNPKNHCKVLKVNNVADNDLFTTLNALRCLLIGNKYKCVDQLALRFNGIRLGLFSHLCMNDGVCTNDKVLEEFLLETLLMVLSKYFCQMSDFSQLTKIHFPLLEQLLQFGTMVGFGTLINRALHKCVREMEALLKELSLIVPFTHPLPSPPLYCHQMETMDENMPSDDTKSGTQEIAVRSKLSQLIHHFCLLCSASGLSNAFIKYTYEEGMESKHWKKEMKRIFHSLLTGKKNVVVKNDVQWRDLKEVWKSFVNLFLALHNRDKLSITLRKLIEVRVNKSKYAYIEEFSSKATQEASLLFHSNNWKDEAYNLIVTLSRDAKADFETIRLFASVSSTIKEVPSLAKYKLDQLFGKWKAIDFVSEEEKYSDDPKMQNMFRFYEEQLCLEYERLSYVTAFPMMQGNENEIVMLFSNTFLKHRNDFSCFECEFPLLCQFLDEIRSTELMGSYSKDILPSFIETKKDDAAMNEAALRTKAFVPSVFKEKKGLFRNLRNGKWTKSPANDVAYIMNTGNRRDCTRTKSEHRSRSSSVSNSRERTNLRRTKSLKTIWKKSDDYEKKVLRISCFSSRTLRRESFSESLERIYNSNLFELSDFSLLSEQFVDLSLWLLRRDKMFDKILYENETESSVDSAILSVDDIKQAIVWYFHGKYSKNLHKLEANHCKSPDNKKEINPKNGMKLPSKKQKKENCDNKGIDKPVKMDPRKIKGNNSCQFEKISPLTVANDPSKDLKEQLNYEKIKGSSLSNSKLGKTGLLFDDNKYSNHSDLKLPSQGGTVKISDRKLLEKCDETDEQYNFSSQVASEHKKGHNINNQEVYEVPCPETKQGPWEPFNSEAIPINKSEIVSPNNSIRNVNTGNIDDNYCKNIRDGYKGINSSKTINETFLVDKNETSDKETFQSTLHEPYSTNVNSLDDTLNDVTLLNSSDSNIDINGESSEEKGKPVKNVTFGDSNFKNKERNGGKLKLLKFDLKEEESQDGARNLELKPVPYFSSEQPTQPTIPIPLNLSEIFCGSPCNQIEQPETWKLKEIPSELMRKPTDRSADQDSIQFHPLKIPATVREACNSKPSTKEHLLESYRYPHERKIGSFQLLRLPFCSEFKDSLKYSSNQSMNQIKLNKNMSNSHDAVISSNVKLYSSHRKVNKTSSKHLDSEPDNIIGGKSNEETKVMTVKTGEAQHEVGPLGKIVKHLQKSTQTDSKNHSNIKKRENFEDKNSKLCANQIHTSNENDLKVSLKVINTMQQTDSIPDTFNKGTQVPNNFLIDNKSLPDYNKQDKNMKTVEKSSNFSLTLNNKAEQGGKTYLSQESQTIRVSNSAFGYESLVGDNLKQNEISIGRNRHKEQQTDIEHYGKDVDSSTQTHDHENGHSGSKLRKVTDFKNETIVLSNNSDCRTCKYLIRDTHQEPEEENGLIPERINLSDTCGIMSSPKPKHVDHSTQIGIPPKIDKEQQTYSQRGPKTITEKYTQTRPEQTPSEDKKQSLERFVQTIPIDDLQVSRESDHLKVVCKNNQEELSLGAILPQNEQAAIEIQNSVNSDEQLEVVIAAYQGDDRTKTINEGIPDIETSFKSLRREAPKETNVIKVQDLIVTPGGRNFPEHDHSQERFERFKRYLMKILTDHSTEEPQNISMEKLSSFSSEYMKDTRIISALTPTVVNEKNQSESTAITSSSVGEERDYEGILIPEAVDQSQVAEVQQESVQDIVNLFVQGNISYDQTINLLSSSSEMIKLFGGMKEDTEIPEVVLRRALSSVKKFEKEISATRKILEKVEDIVEQFSRQESRKTSQLDKLFEPPQSSEIKLELSDNFNRAQLLEYVEKLAHKDLSVDIVKQILDMVEREAIGDEVKSTSDVAKYYADEVESQSTLCSTSPLPSLQLDIDTDITSNVQSFASDKRSGLPQHQTNYSSRITRVDSVSSAISFTASESSDVKERRRKEIRSWMLRKRRERAEKAKETSPPSNARERTLSGKEILGREKTMELRREELKEDHWSKRTQEIEALLGEYQQQKLSVEKILTAKRSSPPPLNKTFTVKKRKLDNNTDNHQPKKYEKTYIKNRSPSKSPPITKFYPPLNLPLGKHAIKHEMEQLKDVLNFPVELNRSNIAIRDTTAKDPKQINVLSKPKLQRRFTSSLERISEIETPPSDRVDSSLTDSSWSLPDDVKRILN